MSAETPLRRCSGRVVDSFSSEKEHKNSKTECPTINKKPTGQPNTHVAQIGQALSLEGLGVTPYRGVDDDEDDEEVAYHHAQLTFRSGGVHFGSRSSSSRSGRSGRGVGSVGGSQS